MAEKKISVIIPVYNSQKYLKRCLDSVIAQSKENLEIILIENGSSDKSPEICDEYEKNDGRICVINSANRGISDARNQGMDVSSGEYITFVDSDDFIQPDYCLALEDLLESNEADLAIGAIRDVYKENEVFRDPAGRTFIYTAKEALSEMLKGKKINGSLTCKLYKRELIREKRFPLGLTYEDAWLLPEIILDAKKIAVTDRTFYTYWHRADSITTSEFSTRALDAITAYDHVLEVVRERCPDCVPEAEFRHYWSYFVVLDRMLASENYKQIPEYGKVVRFLKDHVREIQDCPFFEKSRRIAAGALKMGVPFYKVLLRAHSKRTEANE